ncbi:MAG: bacteriohemerythrin [Actinomycetota bacterium]
MILWRDAMSVGSPALDADHKRLIDLVNRAEQGIAAQDWERVAGLSDALVDYVQIHFGREEAVMAAIGYLARDTHIKAHEGFAAKARLLQAKVKEAASDAELRACAEVLLKLTADWLLNHILKEDMRFKPLVSKTVADAPPPPEPEPEDDGKARIDGRGDDIGYEVPANLAHLLSRISYVAPDLPEPAGGFDSFDKLCVAAIWRRMDKVLVFFQRHNPALARELPPFFLSSPEFAEKFRDAVAKLIFPTIWESRQLRMLATSFDWAGEDTDGFWEHVTRPLQDSILGGWNAAWDNLRLVEVKKPDGKRVMQVKEEMKALRQMLAPSTPEAYDLPRIGNREIETFRSLLDPANDWWVRLNDTWRLCHDLYEQEKDPRVFQQRAREGALRDSLLEVLHKLPPEWGDFLVLTLHRVFPRVSSMFLESFVANFGTTDEKREAHMPYTMRYLVQVRADPMIRIAEQQAERVWHGQMKELKDYLAHRDSQAAAG